jgi:hypothetical protein
LIKIDEIMITLDKIELVVDDENKNKFGEVFTNIELIAEMLIDIDCWEDPSKTYYDPTCGYGYFLFFVYDVLMGNGFKYKGYENVNGLKNVILDEGEREKHIVENMLYGTDIQQKSVDICNNLFRSDLYKTNFICADFLEYETESTFNNIIGNPPFEDYRGGKRKAKNHNLWRPIIMKSYSMLEKDGNMAFVCPQSWMSYSKTNSDMFGLFNSNDVLSLNINECKKYFKGVGSSFSYFFIRNSKNGVDTRLICEYRGKNYNSTTKLQHNNFFPLLINDLSLSIINKVVFSNHEKFDLKFDSYLHAYTKKANLRKERSTEFCHKVWHTPNSVLWSNKEHLTQNSFKILIPISTYYEKMLIDVSGNTQGMGYILCDDQSQAEDIKKVLLLKVYRFLVNITRWSNWNSPDILRSLPMAPIGCDDNFLYKKFGLTNDEIKLIEDIIK